MVSTVVTIQFSVPGARTMGLRVAYFYLQEALRNAVHLFNLVVVAM